MDLEKLRILIRSFKIKNKKSLDKELNYYMQLSTVEEVIENAVLARNSNGKRHAHQRRLKQTVLENVKGNVIKRKQDILDCKSFKDLFSIISECSEKGFGELAIYDTSLRIGTWLGKFPTVVYLHRGTRIGAKRLGIPISDKTLCMTELPNPLRDLEPYEIEDFLCVYKSKI